MKHVYLQVFARLQNFHIVRVNIITRNEVARPITRLFGIEDAKEQDKSVDDTHVKKRNLKG